MHSSALSKGLAGYYNKILKNTHPKLDPLSMVPGRHTSCLAMVYFNEYNDSVLNLLLKKMLVYVWGQRLVYEIITSERRGRKV